MTECKLLQIGVAVAATVPVTAGAMTVALGPEALGLAQNCDVSCDSHHRYLSGLLLGIGLVYWSLIPSIERKLWQFSLLTLIVTCGGVARLSAIYWNGFPNMFMTAALGMELVVTPLLWFWLRRLAHEADYHDIGWTPR